MIARNLKAGRFAEGIINYAFTGKEASHTDKQAEILRYSDELLMPAGPQDKEGIKELTQQFNARTSDYLTKNPENKNALIGHQIVSFTKDDEHKLKPEGIQKALDDYIKLASLNKTQYAAIAHKDTSNYHIHIIYHKVGNDGKKETDWRLNNKTVERGVALALKNRLTLVKGQKAIALTKPVLEIRSKDADIQKLRNDRPELQQAKNMHHFNKLLEEKKIVPEYLNDGRVRIDKTIYRPEDLNAVFQANRNEQNPKQENRQVKSQSVAEQPDKARHDPEKKRSSLSVPFEEEPPRSSPFSIVTIASNENELQAVKRKRKGKHYLLKNTPPKHVSQSKGQKL